MKSCVLIGRGPSILKGEKNFIQSHDDICVVNRVKFSGYENFIGNQANIQFRNSTCENYSKEELKTIGLKKIIFTGGEKQTLKLPKNYNDIITEIPKPNLNKSLKEKFNFDFSSGMQALYYLIDSKLYDKITLIGFDFYEVGTQPYYFTPNEADSNLKYLWKDKYKDNTINRESGHNSDKSLDLLKKLIQENPNIMFTIITNNSKLSTFSFENLVLL